MPAALAPLLPLPAGPLGLTGLLPLSAGPLSLAALLPLPAGLGLFGLLLAARPLAARRSAAVGLARPPLSLAAALACLPVAVAPRTLPLATVCGGRATLAAGLPRGSRSTVSTLRAVPHGGVLPGCRHDALDALRFGADVLEQLLHVDADDAFELLGRLAGEDVCRGGVAQALDRARNGLVGDRVEANDDLLPLAQVGPLGFLDPGQQFHFGQVQQLRHRHARRDLVPFADLGQRLPKAAAPAGAVLQDGHQPRERCKHARLRDSALVAIHVQLRLVQLLP